MNVYDKKNVATSYISHGPRGEYYKWCKLGQDGNLSFGEEEGNYAGGCTLDYNTLYEGKARYIFRDKYIASGGKDHAFTAKYIKHVKQEIETIYDHDPFFYTAIIVMLCNMNNKDSEKWLKRIQEWNFGETEPY